MGAMRVTGELLVLLHTYLRVRACLMVKVYITYVQLRKGMPSKQCIEADLYFLIWGFVLFLSFITCY